MDKLQVLILLAVVSYAACGLRYRRQADSSEEDLEDRYGWNRPDSDPWRRPNNQFNPNFYPNQNWQNMNQNNRPNMNQNWPNMNQNWPNMNQNNRPNMNQNNRPNTGPNVPTQPPTTQAPSNGVTTQSPEIQNCLLTCPVTAEYNPVCGSNGQTYDNPGRLSCAQLCGVTVSLLRSSRCPATTTTAAPTS
ncbi:unnamed protein product [Colias eurytheme]|nr:unnamed protein product [Colias eurytheme]